MLNPCSVIYWPGYGGNFISFCLALSPETVPYSTEDFRNAPDEHIMEIRNYTARQRKDILEYKTVQDYNRLHTTKNVVGPDIYYRNPLINDYYQWTIHSNHPEDCQHRLVWLKKIFYLELDMPKYGGWLHASSKKFNFQFKTYDQLTANERGLESQLIANPLTTVISMTAILDSTDGFVNEYLKMCNILNITPVTDVAVEYYTDWYKVRVEEPLNSFF